MNWAKECGERDEDKRGKSMGKLGKVSSGFKTKELHNNFAEKK